MEAMRMNKGKDYTNKWTDKKFDSTQVQQYDLKFYSRFEKNIKHKQQVRLIKKYLKPEMN